MADVFISYHVGSANSDVQQIAEALEQRGIPCWYCKEDVQGGESFPDEAMKAIKQSKVFVLILDRGSVQSPHVLNELATAFEEQKRGLTVLPFKREAYRQNDKIQYFLKTIQIIGDLNTPMDERIEELAERIAGLVQPKTAEPSFAQAAPTLQDEAKSWNLHGAVEVLDREAVEKAAKDCTEKDVKAFYRVSGNFGVDLRTLAAGRDVARPRAAQAVADLLAAGPVLLTGNGGMGKSTLMLRAAIQWALSGGVAVWVRLDDLPDDGGTLEMLDSLCQWREDGRRVLVCLENPAWGRKGMDALREAWMRRGLGAGRPSGKGGCVQLLLAERNVRLAGIIRQGGLNNWFDGASALELRRTGDAPFNLKGYAVIPAEEESGFRDKILVQSAASYVKDGTVSQTAWLDVKNMVRERYDRPRVNLVELIYRMVFALKSVARRDGSIALDWEEWGRVLRERSGVDADDTRLYGGIAALSLFGMPMPLSLFCRMFDRLNNRERDLILWLQQWQAIGTVEPVVYKSGGLRTRSGRDWGTLRPKHDIISDLFFLFLNENDPGGEAASPLDLCVLDVIDFMWEPEVEELLRNMVNQKSMRELTARDIGRVSYGWYTDRIYSRYMEGSLGLSENARALLCLGLLWWDGGNRMQEWDGVIHEMLESAAPEPDGGLNTSVLYTEWGIWLAKNRRDKEAEEKFRKVREASSTQLQCRVELGRLLARQGKNGEAEELFREAMRIDPTNLQSRTELGRLLAKQGRNAEAEALYRDVIKLKPNDIQSRVELGRLLAQQGKTSEAEELYREALRIDPKNLPPRVELGRLLARQGKNMEAEELYREVMHIDTKNLQSRMELGKLMERMGKPKEAKALYEEILSLDKDNWRVHDRLKNMKDV